MVQTTTRELNVSTLNKFEYISIAEFMGPLGPFNVKQDEMLNSSTGTVGFFISTTAS